MIDTVAAEIAAVSPLIGDLEKIGLRSETSLVNFDMTAARDHAWFVAQRLAGEPSVLHDLTIDGVDLAVSFEGRSILYPLVGREGLKVIQQAEVKDVRRVVEVLSQSGAPLAQERAQFDGETLAAGLCACLFDRGSEGEEVVHLGHLQRGQQPVIGAHQDHLPARVLARNVCSHQAADTSRVNVGHIGEVKNQKVGCVRADHALQRKEVPKQERSVQTDDHGAAGIVNFLYL